MNGRKGQAQQGLGRVTIISLDEGLGQPAGAGKVQQGRQGTAGQNREWEGEVSCQWMFHGLFFLLKTEFLYVELLTIGRGWRRKPWTEI